MRLLQDWGENGGFADVVLLGEGDILGTIDT